MIIVFVLVAFWIYIWALYKGVIYALPVIAGFYAAHFANDTGAGFWGTGVVFVFVAFFVYVLGQQLYARLTWRPARLALSAAYCVPAGLIAFFSIQDLADMSASHGPTEIWELVFASAGALIAASVAFARLSALAPNPIQDDVP